MTSRVLTDRRAVTVTMIMTETVRGEGTGSVETARMRLRRNGRSVAGAARNEISSGKKSAGTVTVSTMKVR
jgi:hypothetical protein